MRFEIDTCFPSDQTGKICRIQIEAVGYEIQGEPFAIMSTHVPQDLPSSMFARIDRFESIRKTQHELIQQGVDVREQKKAATLVVESHRVQYTPDRLDQSFEFITAPAV
ncbi:hypothetical protein [Coriobacterium glomerans]|uniref:hypothetical protein n=1 Tax=Coriobacterium glomerans TaxID=33871 RepID=UPI00155AF5FC|nr:hypothetical protein [Coriobacterium glomerans]